MSGWTDADRAHAAYLEEVEAWQRDQAVEQVVAEVEAGVVRSWTMEPDEEPCRRCGLPLGRREGACSTCGAPRDESSDEGTGAQGRTVSRKRNVTLMRKRPSFPGGCAGLGGVRRERPWFEPT